MWVDRCVIRGAGLDSTASRTILFHVADVAEWEVEERLVDILLQRA